MFCLLGDGDNDNKTHSTAKGKNMKTFRALLLSFFAMAHFAFSNTASTDFTDLWWNANESGWGVTATNQGEVVFLTFFVYGTDNKPVWYTGQVSRAGTTSQGAFIFSGPMYQTSGPWLGTFFNPNAVGVRQVGTATFTAFITSATLTYSVDGTLVNKSLTRQTFRNNDLTGDYGGVVRATNAGCANPLNNGTVESVYGIRIAHSGTSFSMSTNDNLEVCTYSGNYTQGGRMGRSIGTYTCPGRNGTYDFFELEAGPGSITGRLTLSNNLCSQGSGHFALAKRL